MLIFEHTTNAAVAANSTEDIFNKIGLRGILREFQMWYDGDDTTGDINASLLRITVDGIVCLTETFQDIRNHWCSTETGAASSGITAVWSNITANKSTAFRFTDLNIEIQYSLQIEIFNNDPTNAANIYSAITYENQIKRPY